MLKTSQASGNREEAGGVERLAAEERQLDLDTAPEDSEIVTRVCSGETAAYAHLVDRHAPVAVRTAALLGAGADAEDVVQEAFVKAYAALGGLRPGAPFRPWFLRIVANETKNLHRSAGRRSARERRAWRQAEPLLLATSPDPAEDAIATERTWVLVQGLAGLSPDQRDVVTCRYLLDLDEAETAAVLGWPRGTVKSRLHRALKRLRDSLEVS